ncbi:hypothetical protein BS47DRAFT_1288729 [Hydnum rufescens UP504]|uniref:Nudix hydrolase domain-containing protein n=1 Tax=Hydnum rufescens UP504 TaxID=1448309 RepID=A0A9P6B8D4_9AGAM|nr:hypothetical protein BS47DRAFT_1288729 [Hydnum rufescens UP504]
MTSPLLPPPGLPDTRVTRLIVDGGNHAIEWDTLEVVKRYTNAFVINEHSSEILLGFKKRGFGVNKYNGFGGKVEPNETAMEAARRELKEEAGIDAPLEHCGTLLFKSVGFAYAHHIDIYRAAKLVRRNYRVSDTLNTSIPSYFVARLTRARIDPTKCAPSGSRPRSIPNCTVPTPVNGIPYDDMWQDDRMWLPLLLANTKFVGRVDFGASPSGDPTAADGPMVKWWFAEVSTLNEM